MLTDTQTDGTDSITSTANAGGKNLLLLKTLFRLATLHQALGLTVNIIDTDSMNLEKYRKYIVNISAPMVQTLFLN